MASGAQLWTRGRIAAVIRLAFGVSYHPTHVGRLCKAIRWSPQKPARRARQRDEAAIARWRERPGPPSKRGGRPSSRRILFIDESGFYPLPSVVRTYAPVGQTPILREWWTRDHLSAISAISPEGKLYFHCQDHAINSEDVVAFLEHLLREVSGPHGHHLGWRADPPQPHHQGVPGEWGGATPPPGAPAGLCPGAEP